MTTQTTTQATADAATNARAEMEHIGAINQAHTAVLHYRRQAKNLQDATEYAYDEAQNLYREATFADLTEAARLAREYDTELRDISRKIGSIYDALEEQRRHVLRAKKDPATMSTDVAHRIGGSAEGAFAYLEKLAAERNKLAGSVDELAQEIAGAVQERKDQEAAERAARMAKGEAAKAVYMKRAQDLVDEIADIAGRVESDRAEAARNRIGEEAIHDLAELVGQIEGYRDWASVRALSIEANAYRKSNCEDTLDRIGRKVDKARAAASMARVIIDSAQDQEPTQDQEQAEADAAEIADLRSRAGQALDWTKENATSPEDVARVGFYATQIANADSVTQARADFEEIADVCKRIRRAQVEAAKAAQVTAAAEQIVDAEIARVEQEQEDATQAQDQAQEPATQTAQTPQAMGKRARKAANRLSHAARYVVDAQAAQGIRDLVEGGYVVEAVHAARTAAQVQQAGDRKAAQGAAWVQKAADEAAALIGMVQVNA